LLDLIVFFQFDLELMSRVSRLRASLLEAFKESRWLSDELDHGLTFLLVCELEIRQPSVPLLKHQG
jgi:hypothetical protein